MHEEILDHEEGQPNNHHYKKSKRNLMVAGGLILLLVLLAYYAFGLVVSINSILPIVIAVMMIIILISSFLGVYNVIQSYVKKEMNSPGKPIILVGNSLIAGFFLIAFIMNFWN